MADMVCGHTGNRDEILVAYLYDDIDPIERASFDAHLTSCERCRAELADLGVVRQRLATWSPPVYGAAGRTLQAASLAAPATSRQSWWRGIPAWAQVAAALQGVAAIARNIHDHFVVAWSFENSFLRAGAVGSAGVNVNFTLLV